MTKVNNVPNAKVYVSKPIKIDFKNLENLFERADLEFYDIEHAESSFEGRVFLNNPDANINTEKTKENGYVDSFYVFSHGGCFGDAGHCDIRKERRKYDTRPVHPLTPTFTTVTITSMLKEISKKTNEIIVTVVPVPMGGSDMCNFEDIFKFKKLSLVTYDK